ncbi:MAG: cyclic nucleotide-binding domain-containing protein [Mameliella sp.]|nr:cyclic nucleotide-binding domain-containing protein [Phaeodactylibacter sp.]
MENIIPRRVYDFLKAYPPFSLLPEELLLQVSERVVVQYCQPKQEVFHQGDQPGAHIYIVREGAVQLFRETKDEEFLVEQCDEGDVFGIRPMLAEETYALTSRAAEETLLYAINIEGFREVLEAHPQVAFYLASTYAAGVGQKYKTANPSQLFLDRSGKVVENFALMEVQSLERSKAPVTCAPEVSIQEAAVIMSEQEVGSIIVVDEKGCPFGIMTDKDLRRKVATGKMGLQEPVSAIMSSPVITMPPTVTVADVQMEMVRNRINHICLTEGGTPESIVVGVLSEHDLMVMQGNNPAILIREIRRCKLATDLKDIRDRAEQLLKKYIFQEVSIAFISTVMTEINDEIIIRCIELAEAEIRKAGLQQPAAKYCWLALGSEGRGEQLLRTDQDNALVFEDVPEAEYENTKAYYLDFAGRVTRLLNEVGFEYCPADMMASNPLWCLSLTEWKQQFSTWIHKPEHKAVMFGTIFFDFRPIHGEEELSKALTSHIFEALDDQEIFLVYLGKNALQNPPPLTFFRNFVVENSGAHKDEFDIKARAMMPLADAARLLVLNARVGMINNTFRRFERLAEIEPQNKELYEQAADAYEILMRYRALQGLKKQNSGRYFNPSDLTKMERINLRNSFRPIKELQSLLNTRFRLALLS